MTKNVKNKVILIIALTALLALHLPFLTADPDIDISFSRGPFTDEGLNTIQMRNFINHGYLDINECDNLLKTPLYNLYLSPFLFIFGTDLPVARIAILFSVLLIAFFHFKRSERISFFFVIAVTGLLQYHLFHFSHFALAEMLAVMLITSGIMFFYQYTLSNHRKWLVMGALAIAMSYFAKIQFVYLIPLPPLLFFLMFRLRRRKDIITVLWCAILPAAVYFFAWFIPFREDYIHMMEGQSGTFSLGPKTFEYLRFNLEHFFFIREMMIISVIFTFSLAAGLYILLRKRHSIFFKVVFTASLLWFLLEAHKLTMVYLPTRYQVSLLFSMAMIISVVVFEWLSHSEDPVLIRSRILAWFILGLVFIQNIYDYRQSIDRRTYHLKEINDYMAKSESPGGPVLGAWAPSVTWKSRQRALPVWDRFLNYRDPVNTFQPAAIVSEVDEEDSNQAYKNQGIELASLADSIHETKIGHWHLRVYWIHPKKNAR